MTIIITNSGERTLFFVQTTIVPEKAPKINERITCGLYESPVQKVIIIENSDRLDFKKKIEEKYSNVTCYLAGENLGYAKGNNLGLSKVKSKYALILNPDTELSSDALAGFIDLANTKKNFAINLSIAKKSILNLNPKFDLNSVALCSLLTGLGG